MVEHISNAADNIQTLNDPKKHFNAKIWLISFKLLPTLEMIDPHKDSTTGKTWIDNLTFFKLIRRSFSIKYVDV